GWKHIHYGFIGCLFPAWRAVFHTGPHAQLLLSGGSLLRLARISAVHKGSISFFSYLCPFRLFLPFQRHAAGQ
ncbi:MAG: hypothetical protein KHW46_05410, partial [Clostridiales bacterium]|nr:hypothetical protein [Clostridiales bacterium]